MANVKIMVDGALMDGHRVTFKAPCNCVEVEKLKICYVKDGEQQSKLFTMKDSHGNNLTRLGNLFSKGAYVDAILDTNNNVAYLQNAATNRYLEQKMEPLGDASKVWVTPGGNTIYNFGCGSPGANGYNAGAYKDEAYVDSMTGEVYEVVEFEIVGGDGSVEKGYEWAMSDQLDSVRDKINELNTPEIKVVSTGKNVQNVNTVVQKIGKMCVLTGIILTKDAVAVNDIILTVPYKPKYGAKGGAFYCSSSSVINLNLDSNGLYSPNRSIPTNTYLSFNIAYICE